MNYYASSTYGMHNHSMLSWLFDTNRKDCVVLSGWCVSCSHWLLCEFYGVRGLGYIGWMFSGVVGDSLICVGTVVYLICRSVMTWSPPLCMQLSRNVISVGETWEVNLIVAWC